MRDLHHHQDEGVGESKRKKKRHSRRLLVVGSAGQKTKKEKLKVVTEWGIVCGGGDWRGKRVARGLRGVNENYCRLGKKKKRIRDEKGGWGENRGSQRWKLADGLGKGKKNRGRNRKGTLTRHP